MATETQNATKWCPSIWSLPDAVLEDQTVHGSLDSKNSFNELSENVNGETKIHEGNLNLGEAKPGDNDSSIQVRDLCTGPGNGNPVFDQHFGVEHFENLKPEFVARAFEPPMKGIDVFTNRAPSGVEGVQGKSTIATEILDGTFIEPLAIVGMAFKFPGGIETESEFWDMLVSKRCASSDFPPDRMNIDAFYTADSRKPHSINTRKGHFLHNDVREFDAQHFGITPTEASSMDPAQRGLMETTYHAIENAGIPTAALSGTNTSVHVGFFSTDFTTFGLRDPQCIPKYYGTGSSSAILANRLSWHFNLRGPSMTIDTACSSGLVAMDLACQGLWAGTTEMAIVGAANLIVSPELNIALSKMNFLSPEGKCFSFDHRGSGYARGEGFTAFVLQPLSKALAAGNTVRALVRNIASNQDGHTSGGLTQPSKEMQTQLIRETYRRAGLDMRNTRYFEAHGTGTAIGDPIEASAIGESFREHRTDTEPLYIGAVKSNIGHLEGASGLAGVIKAILALERSIIPPNTNFERINPKIDAEFFRLEFPQECVSWPHSAIKRVSVNSFGFGGSNAHVVLDDVESYLRSSGHRSALVGNGADHLSINLSTPDFKEYRRSSATLVLLSSSDESGLSRQINAHINYWKAMDRKAAQTVLLNYSHTLASHRTHLPWRSFAVIDSLDEATSLSSSMSLPIYNSQMKKSNNLGFIFTGQGAQWFGMARELFMEPVFRESIDRCQAYLKILGCSWNIADHLTKEEHAESFSEARHSQVLTTSIQLALVELIGWVGVTPTVVIGHSSGEIAAAYAAGHISMMDAVKISYYRGLLAYGLEKNTSSEYGMAAIGLSREAVLEEIDYVRCMAPFQLAKGLLTVSCINSPTSVTVSGPISHLDCLMDRMKLKKIFFRRLSVGLGYHSPQMELISDVYGSLLSDICPQSAFRPGKPVMVSSVTAGLVNADTVGQAAYWVRNMASPVEFLDAINFCKRSESIEKKPRSLGEVEVPNLNVSAWLELGPHSALRGPVLETMSQSSTPYEMPYLSALVRKRSALSSVLAAFGELHCRSYPIDLSKAIQLGLRPLERKNLRILTDLPKYSFNRSILHWEESYLNKSFRFRKHGNHDLIGTQLIGSNPLESSWQFIIKEEELPWVRDHKVNGLVLYPAAGMIAMVIEAASQLASARSPLAFELENVEFLSAIMLSSESVRVCVHLSAMAKDGKGDLDCRFRIVLDKGDTDLEVVCSGRIRADYGRIKSDVDFGRQDEEALADLRAELKRKAADCTIRPTPKRFYEIMAEDLGFEYGPAFQVLNEIGCNRSGFSIASLVGADPPTFDKYVIHPTKLDGILQLSLAGLWGMKKTKAMVPTRASRIWIPASVPTSNVKVFSTIQESTRRTATSNLRAFSTVDSKICAMIDGLEVTAVEASVEATTDLANAPVYCAHMEWNVDIDCLSGSEVDGFCELARPSTAEPIQYFNTIDAMIYEYGARALLKVDLEGGHIASHMKKYTDWLRFQINSRTLPRMNDKDLEQVCESVKDTARGEMNFRVGKHLAEFIQGSMDPLQIIFSDEAKVTAFYGELMDETTGIYPFLRYLDMLVHKRPGLKFLEVGAGTGSSTTKILQTIGNANFGPRYESYTYTDISPFFFEQARMKFAQYCRLNYQVLNVEEDISLQGFQPETYDVIIADNVIHATSNLGVTLQNIRKLLRPGGKLLLKELDTPERLLTGFAFGLLPGWWLAVELDRKSSPLLTKDRWHTLLQDTGFSGVDLSFADHFSSESHVWSMMVSTAKDSISLSPSIMESSALAPRFIVDPNSTLQHDAAMRVASLLDLKNKPVLLSLEEVAICSDVELGKNKYIMLNEMEGSTLKNISEDSFHSLQRFLTRAQSVLWIKTVSESDTISSVDCGMSDGLCRVVRRETNSSIVSLAVESNSVASLSHIAKIHRILANSSSQNPEQAEQEYQEMDGRLCVNRLIGTNALNEHVFKRTTQPMLRQQIGESRLSINIRALGLLDTIGFVEQEAICTIGHMEVDVEIRAVGINYKDCLAFLGKFNTDRFGSECAGVVRDVGSDVKNVKVGDRVVVFCHGVFATHVRAPARTIFPIPQGMSFVEAASIPTSFCTAYYCIVKLAALKRGQSILIHTAAGGTGQAMIQLAKYAGAEIYATVGSSAKRHLLKDQYGIPEPNIFYSRDSSFADGIMKATCGKGVDVIINSQQGRLLEASWNCIALGGRFIDIGLKDAYLGGQLSMEVFKRNASFFGVNLHAVLLHQEELAREILEGTMNLFTDGKARPVSPLTVYPLEEVESAVRLMQSGKSSGKVILEVRKEAIVPVAQGVNSSYRFPADATYVIAGGLGGVGRSLARWLVQRGARHLILLARSVPNEQAQDMLEEMRTAGVNVQTPRCDITDSSALQAAVSNCQQTMPKIRGCIQSAMTLRDALFSEMTFEQWNLAVNPKVLGTWNLHSILPSEMDFFILLSSVAGVIGHHGQSNYCAGNTYEDVFARYRSSKGQKTVSIDLGVVLGEGFVAENEDIMKRLMRLGFFRPNTLEEVFSIMDYYCSPRLKEISPAQSHVITGFELARNLTAKGLDRPTALEQPLFKVLLQAEGSQHSAGSLRPERLTFESAFMSARSASEAQTVVSEALKQKLGRVLGISLENISSDSTLDEFGVDSLVGVELRNWLAKEAGAELAVFEILGGGTLEDIADLVIAKSSLTHASWDNR